MGPGYGEPNVAQPLSGKATWAIPPLCPGERASPESTGADGSDCHPATGSL